MMIQSVMDVPLAPPSASCNACETQECETTEGEDSNRLLATAAVIGARCHVIVVFGIRICMFKEENWMSK